MRRTGWVTNRRLEILLVCVVLAGCAARQPGEPIRPGFNMYSPQDDIELGRQAADAVRKQVDVVDNPALQSYVTEVGKRLAGQPSAGDYPYSFTLINDDSINAFALPGGPIFIHSALLEAADNEPELAGVLAHEISHVVLRHGTSQASKANLVQLPAVLAGTVIGDGGALAQLGQLGVGFGLNALIMKYSRDAERQADANGVRILIEAGYDPLAMASFFEKLEAEGGPRQPAFLSSHPDPGNRRSAVLAEVAALPPSDSVYAGTGSFPRMQQLAANLPPPNPPQPPAQAAAPVPAIAGFETLNAGPYAVSHPGEWQTYADGNTQTVTIVPQGGLVRLSSGQAAIGYGAVFSYYRPQTRNTTLSRATNELLQRLQNSSNSRFQLAGSQQQLTVDGNPALLTPLASPSPYGGAESDVLVTVGRPEGLFYAVFVAPEGQFSRVQPAFERMINSVQFR